MVDDGVVDGDDLVIDFDGVGDEHSVLIDPEHAFGDAGLAVTGGAVEKDRILGDERGAELIEEAVGDDQVEKGLAKGTVIDLEFGRLCFGGGVVFLE